MELKDFNPVSVRERFKESPWFPKESRESIYVLGCGGIGSWLSFFLSRIGYEIVIVDMDKIEIHNLGGQFFKERNIGDYKVSAVFENIASFGCDTENVVTKIARADSVPDHWIIPSKLSIVCPCFDNMSSRESIFLSSFDMFYTNIFIENLQVLGVQRFFCNDSDHSRQDLTESFKNAFFRNGGDVTSIMEVTDSNEVIEALSSMEEGFDIEEIRVTEGNFSDLSLNDLKQEVCNLLLNFGSAMDKKKENMVIVDGRLEAEQLQVFSFKMDEQDKVIRYYNEGIFSDDEVEEEACSFKQTSHVASMIGSLMTSTITNYYFNHKIGRDIRKIPFKVEFTVPNMNFEKQWL